MREWSTEDLDRWSEELRDNELSWQSQAEMVQYTKDMHFLYNQAVDEIQRLRSLWLLVNVPVTQLMRLVHAFDEGSVGERVVVDGVRFFVLGLEKELLGD